MTIHKWKELEKDFCEGIILGNGASIAIDPIFSYPSLLESARKDLINPDIDKIFKYLKTDDFELVLHTLWDVYNINNTLGITDPKIKNAYSEIRTALIRAVEKNHVTYQNVSQYLLAIAAFLKHFKTVISLNYDFIVYWAMLTGNEKWGKNRFKDCFVNNGEFEEDWDWLRDPYNSSTDGASLIFYPHGNLVLAFDRYGVEKKIARDKNNLMDKIRKSWESGDYSPLFVSEGNSEQKLKAIKRSPYLSNVYNYALKDLGEKVVIFGWSLSEHDDHILKEILKNDKLQRIAVAVDSEKKEKCDEIKDKIVKFYRNQKMSYKKTMNNRDIEVIFFDRASPGCWINE